MPDRDRGQAERLDCLKPDDRCAVGSDSICLSSVRLSGVG